MRVAFLGSPEIATIPLRALVDAGHDVVTVVTKTDKRRSRRGEPEPGPVKRVALELGLTVSHSLDDVVASGAEIAVVAAFGRIIPAPYLEQIEFLNIHPSLLPRWRGAAPVQHTILAGDTETGVCLMRLVDAMDEGPLYAVTRTRVGDRETADDLLVRLFEEGSRLLIQHLAGPPGEPIEQRGEATYAGKLTPEDMRIDWTASAAEIDRKIRAGRAWTTFRDKRLRVIEAEPQPGDSGKPGTLDSTVVATGEGQIRLVTVQPEGKGPQAAAGWVNGARLKGSDRLV